MLARGSSTSMNKKQELRAIKHREQRIDEALEETFPASDTPSFVGGDARIDDKALVGGPRRRAVQLAGEVIDQHADASASSEEQESRKQKLLKGPSEFRDLRRDLPRQKGTK